MHWRPGTRVIAPVIWCVLLMACGGGNGGGGGGGDPADGVAAIEGRVSGVAGGAARAGEGTTAGVPVAGIQVEARRGAQVLDAATTDAQGRFRLEFAGAGTVELVFVTDEVLLSIEVNALPGSVVSLVVELRIDDREVVIIDERLVGSGPIRCRSGQFRVFDEELDLLIDGDGDDCLRVESNCVLDITVRSLRLADCERCIDAQSNGELVITTFPGALSCQAREDAIRAASNALVIVDAHDDVRLDAASGHGIRAESNAHVVLASEGTCFVEADDDPVRIESQATVDLAGCADIVLIGEPDDRDDDDGPDDDDFDDD
jgi:hypothetical protein